MTFQGQIMGCLILTTCSSHEGFNSIHRKKKDGGCTFYHNTLRTKLNPHTGIGKDMV